MDALAPLLLVYDAESAPCRCLVDWTRRRDRACLIVAFPFQNAELARLAPELAGLALQGEVHALDTGTRKVARGPAILPWLFQRLPGRWWMTPLLALPPLRTFAYSILRRSK